MKLVILDRDGVINADSEEHIKSPDEWKALPGSLEAIARLSKANYRVVVATNQSGIARRLFDIGALHKIHEKMHAEVGELGGSIDAVFFCPHGPEEGCECRKPRPGLLLDIARRLGVDLHGVAAIGDALRDIDAARAVGARPILVRTGKGTEALYGSQSLDDVAVYCDLAEAVDALLAEPS